MRDADDAAMRRAVASVTRQISVATVALVVCIVIVAVAFVVWQSQPSELREKATPGEDKIYIDASGVLLALAIIGLGAVLFAAVISWIIARRAVQPLGHALRMQRSFVADASHELRTPLAVLDARLQLLQRRIADDDVNAETVAELRRDTSALIGIVGELLAAAGGEVPDSGEPTDAVSVVTDTVAALRLVAAERSIDIELGVAGATRDGRELFVTAPAVSLRRCVTALVDNAIGHTADGGRVEVTLEASAAVARLTVSDHGPGIRGIAPERVFERFAHSDPDETAGLPRRRGFGIGLALVRDVAARNGGTVRVGHTGPGGTAFVLELPRS